MKTAARIAFVACLSVWAAASCYGAYGIVRSAWNQSRAAGVTQLQQRVDTWSPIYGFAAGCAAGLAPGATILLVDPTTTPGELAAVRTDVGPAAFGAARDVDWPNAAAFEYVTYPHPVSLLGHVPSGWGAASITTDYVAIWNQVAYRSEAARSDASSAALAIGSRTAAASRCDYSDAAGDRGVLFAIGPRSAPFVTGGQTPLSAGLSAKSIGMTTLGLGLIWLIGLVIVLTFGRRLGRVVVIGLALPAGCVAVALEMLVFSLTGIPWSLPALGLPWLLAGAGLAWHLRALLVPQVRPSALFSFGRLSLAAASSLRLNERVALFALAAWTALVTLVAPLALPYSDGFDFYFFKARAFYADAGVVPYYSNAAHFLFSLPAHPPLIPLVVSWLYLFIGGVEEHAALLLWPAIYIALLTAVYGFLRPRTRRSAALWYTLAFAVLATELAKAAQQGSFTDLPLALYLFLATALLWHWARSTERGAGNLLLAGMFLGAAALTKEEGLVMSGVVLVASPLLVFGEKDRPSWWRPSALVGIAWLLVVAPWLYFRLRHSLPVETVAISGGAASVLRRVPTIVLGLTERSVIHTLPAAAVLAAFFLARAANRKRLAPTIGGAGIFLAAVVLGQLAGDTAGMAASRVEVHLQLQIAGTRVLSQLLPVFFFAMFWVWQALFVELSDLGLLPQALKSGVGLPDRGGSRLTRPSEAAG